MLMLAKNFEQGEEVRISWPVGAGLDIITGKFLPGKNNRMHLNGGWNKIMGFGGRGNTYKSTLSRYGSIALIGRYMSTGHIVLDSEDSIEEDRHNQQCQVYDRLAGRDLIDEGFLRISDTSTTLNDWIKRLRNTSTELAKMKDLDKHRITTKFINRRGEQVRTLPPCAGEIDSLTKSLVDVVEDIYDKNEIGDGAMNTESMRGMAAKTQAINQLPKITRQTSMYVTMVAHMTDEIVADKYAPSTKKLAAMKNKIKFVGVPNAYTFLTNTLFICQQTTPLVNASDKGPEYPANSTDRNPSNDLVEVYVYTVRCKTAPTGYGTWVVCSQSLGVQPHLSNLNSLRRHHKYWGLGGNNTTFNVMIYPEVSMTRTTAREKIDSDPKLCRALEITEELRQIHEVHSQRYAEFLTDPQTLYDDIKAKGYCWDKILKTRGYPVSDEQEAAEPDLPPELSTLDLLRLRTGDLELKEFKA